MGHSAHSPDAHSHAQATLTQPGPCSTATLQNMGPRSIAGPTWMATLQQPGHNSLWGCSPQSASAAYLAGPEQKRWASMLVKVRWGLVHNPASGVG